MRKNSLQRKLVKSGEVSGSKGKTLGYVLLSARTHAKHENRVFLGAHNRTVVEKGHCLAERRMPLLKVTRKIRDAVRYGTNYPSFPSVSEVPGA